MNVSSVACKFVGYRRKIHSIYNIHKELLTLSRSKATTIYSIKKSIISGCISFSDEGNSFNITEPNGMLVGDAWYGDITDSCQQTNEGEIAFQLVENDVEGTYFVGSANLLMPDNSACTVTALYQATIK
jgi:hypothetical protein